MKRINLKGLSEVLSAKELKNVMGGSNGTGDCSGLPSGPGCKIKACEEKKNGDSCKFCYNDTVYKGKCANDVMYGQLYCCDMC